MTLKNNEIQVGQFGQTLHSALQRALPSDMVANPKDKKQCHAITLRSGKHLAPMSKEGIEKERDQEIGEESEEKLEEASTQDDLEDELYSRE